MNSVRIKGTKTVMKGCMNLPSQQTETLNKMIEDISQKLNMLNVGVIRAEDFSDEKIEDLTYLHQMVMKKHHSARVKCRPLPRSSPLSENKPMSDLPKTAGLFLI